MGYEKTKELQLFSCLLYNMLDPNGQKVRASHPYN